MPRQMHRRPHAAISPFSGMLALLALLLALEGTGCHSADDVTKPADSRVSKFSLLDVNSTSPTFDTHVSPRDYLGQISAWYFGHAT